MFVSVAGVLMLMASPSWSQSLGELLPQILKSDGRVLAPSADLDSAQQNSHIAWGDWYPQLTAQTWAGVDQELRPSASGRHSTMPAKEADLTVTQLLYDFGKTGAKIDIATLQEDQATVALHAARQALVLDSATAYTNLMRSAETLRYARSSEGNIVKQTGLEEARVQKGGGYTTDLLQAKSQLAGAQARRVRAEGSMVQARNHFTFVFNDVDMKLEDMRWPSLPASAVPPSLNEALAIAADHNLILKNEEMKEEIARGNSKIARSSGFFPRVELVADHYSKKNVGQIAGTENDSTIKVQVTLPINLGGTAINSVRGADSSLLAATHRYKTAKDQVIEAVRNSWQDLSTARENAGYLRNQANIAGEFLELARKERQNGTRSLLDVLNGETVFINAESDAVAAEADVLLAVFKLLYAMGVLEPELVIQTADATAPAPSKLAR